VAVFRGDVPATTGLSDGELARVISAELGALERAWREFLRAFRPLAEAVPDDGGRLDGQSALLARTLLVHSYRRVVLKEPELPADLWPANWVGAAAYEVAARCYHGLARAADSHLATVFEAGGEPLPALERSYAGRYPLAGVPST
jgi:phenylacetic acid degradation operon negative regulatory protein